MSAASRSASSAEVPAPPSPTRPNPSGRGPAPATRARRRRPGGVGGPIALALILVYCLAPIWWMVNTSLKSPNFALNRNLLPIPFSLENFAAVFDAGNRFTRALLNSFIVAGTTTVLVVTIGTFAAYALARLTFRGKPLVLLAIIATSMFPTITLVVPLKQLFSGEFTWFPDWVNTYQAMIVPSMSFALPLAVWNLNAFFRQLPRDLEDAAMIDGCTRGQAFRRVILPIATPGVVTTTIITFVATWNEFLIALTMVNDRAMMTATVAISTFTGISGYSTPYGTIMAAGVVLTVPLIVVVLIFQRRIIGGLAAGSLR